MAGGADRLSNLSDDLLASIISLLPTREAVRTAALSRRWRPVWLRTHSLILDSRSYGDHSDDIWAYIGDWDDGRTNGRLFSDACRFIGATGRCSPVRELSLSVHGRDQEHFELVMGNSCRWGSSGVSYDLMAYLLSASALRSLEEVRVKLQVVQSPAHCRRDKELTRAVYKLNPTELPGHTLRVLDLEHCRLDSPADSAAVSFPRLSSLRLHKCSSSTKDLEGWIRTAPSLRCLHIQDHDFYCWYDDTRSDRFEVHSTSLTALTLALVPSSSSSIKPIFEVDAPRLRTFKYKGKLQQFSMKSAQTTKVLARVDLAAQRIYDKDGKAVRIWSATFWQFLRNFRHAKAIKLKVPNIQGIAVDKDVQHEHLFTLQALETLELRGFSDPGCRDNAALAIANLLQCCPVLQNLRVRIPTDPYHHTRYVDTRREVRVSDFDLCMDVFRRRFSKEMVPPMIDQDDGSVLPGLTGCRFRCLDNHLKNVTLQFELREMNSFEVCLAKFFAENSMVLQVFEIDDGKSNFLKHINWMVQRWRSNALKQRKQMDCDSADSSEQMRKRKRNYRVYNEE
jgi:hypothetical protein